MPLPEFTLVCKNCFKPLTNNSAISGKIFDIHYFFCTMCDFKLFDYTFVPNGNEISYNSNCTQSTRGLYNDIAKIIASDPCCKFKLECCVDWQGKKVDHIKMVFGIETKKLKDDAIINMIITGEKNNG